MAWPRKTTAASVRATRADANPDDRFGRRSEAYRNVFAQAGIGTGASQTLTNAVNVWVTGP